MIFAAPAALFATVVAATPLIIYLLLRRRKTVVDWGASYLLRLTLRSRRKSSVWKQYLVLFLRICILALAALLLAGPARPNPAVEMLVPALPDEPVHRVLLADNSLSMTVLDGGEARQTRLRAIVETLLATQRVGDRVSVAPMATSPLTVHRFEGPLDRGDRKTVSDLLQPTEAALPLGPAFAAAVAALSQTPAAVSEVYLLSDCPRELIAELIRLDWVAAEMARLNATLIPVALAPPTDQANVVVEKLAIGADLIPAGMPVKLYVDVANYASAPATTELVCSIDGQQEVVSRLQLKADERRRLDLDIVFARPGPAVVTVETPASRIAAHGCSDLAVEVAGPLKVWLAAPEARAGADDVAATEFVSRALTAAQAGHRPFDLEVVELARLSQPVAAEVDVILLVAPPFAQAALARTLTAFVSRGGGLILTAASEMNVGGYREYFQELLPALPIGPARAEFDAQVFSMVRADLRPDIPPLFAEFADRAAHDLSAVRVYNYLELDPPAPGASAIFQLTNDAPLLAHRQVGRGQVLMWTTTLSIDWSSLPVRQSFLPFVWRLIHAAAVGRITPRNVAAGDRVVLNTDADAVLVAPDGSRQPVTPVAYGDAHYAVLAAPAAPGVYHVGREGGAMAAFTVADSSLERDLRPLPEPSRSQLSQALGAPIYASWRDAVTALGVAGATTSLWSAILLLMLAMYLLETWVVRQL